MIRIDFGRPSLSKLVLEDCSSNKGYEHHNENYDCKKMLIHSGIDYRDCQCGRDWYNSDNDDILERTALYLTDEHRHEFQQEDCDSDPAYQHHILLPFGVIDTVWIEQ